MAQYCSFGKIQDGGGSYSENTQASWGISGNSRPICTKFGMLVHNYFMVVRRAARGLK